MDFGVRLPLLGLSVPSRNLTEEERAIIERWLITSYDDFVAKVADGRGLSVERIKELAQGHFYSGIDGKDNGLVDEIGGLMSALSIALNRAGIKTDSDFNIVEIPKHKGLIGFSLPFLPVRQDTAADPVLEYLQKLCEEPTRPLFMMLPGTFPTLEE